METMRHTRHHMDETLHQYQRRTLMRVLNRVYLFFTTTLAENY